jgi:hypothetical protein
MSMDLKVLRRKRSWTTYCLAVNVEKATYTSSMTTRSSVRDLNIIYAQSESGALAADLRGGFGGRGIITTKTCKIKPLIIFDMSVNMLNFMELHEILNIAEFY